jgi:hypothetical protein
MAKMPKWQTGKRCSDSRRKIWRTWRNEL